jgi:predicted DNA-binding transcriptional regulator AlpA
MSTNRLIRLKDVLSLIPVSSSTWWEGVRTGKFPKSVKVSPNITAWNLKDILQLIDQLNENIE